MNVRRKNFLEAAQMRLLEARFLLGKDGGHLQAACYLAHVALECALKARLLAMAGVWDVDAFIRRRGMAAENIFRGANGHNLEFLAYHARLRVLLEARQKRGALRTPAWQALSHERRPYSLRYGHEKPERSEAISQIAFAGDMVGIVLTEVPE